MKKVTSKQFLLSFSKQAHNFYTILYHIPVNLRSDPRDEAREAIRPMTVLSPQEITTARAAPSTALVEKKARFLVSMGLSSVHSAPRDWGSDSPVREELSTW